MKTIDFYIFEYCVELQISLIKLIIIWGELNECKHNQLNYAGDKIYKIQVAQRLLAITLKEIVVLDKILNNTTFKFKSLLQDLFEYLNYDIFFISSFQPFSTYTGIHSKENSFEISV